MGRPKALVELAGEPLVLRALRVLAEGGCAPRLVVVGAAAEEVRALLPRGVLVVPAVDWADGMSASLRAGLAGLARLDPVPDAALVHLVDLPGVTAEGISRVAAGTGPDGLARAAYGGVPGHPVLLGRCHWAGVAASAEGDAGARAYLGRHRELRIVECGAAAGGGAGAADVDTPEQLRAFGLADPAT